MRNFGGNPKLGELIPQVQQGLTSGSVNLMILGQELVWLLDVLPPAARGDWTSYETTATIMRAAMRQNLAVLNAEIATMPQFAPMLDAALQQAVAQSGIGPQVEQQIVFLAFVAFGGLE